MNPFIAQFQNWWSARAERERQVLSAGLVLLGIALAYLAVWEPLHGLQNRRIAALTQSRALAGQLELLAAIAPGAGVSSPGGRQQSLFSVVDQSAKASSIGKAPSRIQPEGESTVRVWIEDAPFDAVLRWLAELGNRHGVAVTEAEFERESASGLVNVRLTLARQP